MTFSSHPLMLGPISYPFEKVASTWRLSYRAGVYIQFSMYSTRFAFASLVDGCIIHRYLMYVYRHYRQNIHLFLVYFIHLILMYIIIAYKKKKMRCFYS